MKGKIYITDEGFGPIVRQSAIVDEMLLLNPELEFTIQTQRHLAEAKSKINAKHFIDKYNNITWQKTNFGLPDINAIKEYYIDYLNRSDKFIESDAVDFNYDFVISDYVYEGFKAAHLNKVLSFGVAHFTWDWFFTKLYPPAIHTSVIERFMQYADLAQVLYFPPYTPLEILLHYKGKAKEVPLIVRKQQKKISLGATNKFKVMLIDSGAGVLKETMLTAINQLSKIKDVEFYISYYLKVEADNVKYIGKNELFLDYISQMNLVIGRAGFNTISECIAMRTPMLLLSEAMNPEMNENIIHIKHQGLGSFISLDVFGNQLAEFLPRFIDSEYKMILENMNNHTIASNGAQVVAEDILNRLKNF